MRIRPVPALAAALSAVALVLGGSSGAHAATADNSCYRSSTIGWTCGYYSGTAETDEWSSNTAAVKEIQDLINKTQLYWENGNTPLVVDGSFGPKTVAAVEWVQSTYGLCGGVNGNVGSCTWAYLRWGIAGHP